MRLTKASIGWRKSLYLHGGCLPCMTPYMVENVRDVITPDDTDRVRQCIRYFAPEEWPKLSLFGYHDLHLLLARVEKQRESPLTVTANLRPLKEPRLRIPRPSILHRFRKQA